MLERHGTYREYDWAIIFSEDGFRCGYVAIPEHHILYNKSISDLPSINCHGEITYADKHCISYINSDYVIGFDCGHFPMDAIDLESVQKYYGKERLEELKTWSTFTYRTQGHAWTADEVEAECKHIIDQILSYLLKLLDDIEA